MRQIVQGRDVNLFRIERVELQNVFPPCISFTELSIFDPIRIGFKRQTHQFSNATEFHFRSGYMLSL